MVNMRVFCSDNYTIKVDTFDSDDSFFLLADTQTPVIPAIGTVLEFPFTENNGEDTEIYVNVKRVIHQYNREGEYQGILIFVQFDDEETRQVFRSNY